MLNTIKRSLRLLTSRDKRVLTYISAIQFILATLDLVGVALIGIIGALSINGVQSKAPGNRVSAALRFLGSHESRLHPGLFKGKSLFLD